MKALFFITVEHYSKVKNLTTGDDVVSRQSLNFREARALGFDKEGFYLEIDGSHEAIEAAKKIMEHMAKEVEGHEKEKVLHKIQEQEDNAAVGFGTIFG
jgi:hypothetical protein